VVAAAARWGWWLVAGAAGVASRSASGVCECCWRDAGSKCEHGEQQRSQTLHLRHPEQSATRYVWSMRFRACSSPRIGDCSS